MEQELFKQIAENYGTGLYKLDEVVFTFYGNIDYFFIVDMTPMEKMVNEFLSTGYSHSGSEFDKDIICNKWNELYENRSFIWNCEERRVRINVDYESSALIVFIDSEQKKSVKIDDFERRDFQKFANSIRGVRVPHYPREKRISDKDIKKIFIERIDDKVEDIFNYYHGSDIDIRNVGHAINAGILKKKKVKNHLIKRFNFFWNQIMHK